MTVFTTEDLFRVFRGLESEHDVKVHFGCVMEPGAVSGSCADWDEFKPDAGIFYEMCTLIEKQINGLRGGQKLSTKKVSFDFESIYKKYPRKEGKACGIERCRIQIKTQDDFELLLRAVTRYALHVRENQTEPRFIKLFSSFIGANGTQPWRDWLEPDAGTATNGATGKPVSTLTDAERDELSAARKQWAELF